MWLTAGRAVGSKLRELTAAACLRVCALCVCLEISGYVS
jgi:hypothetical protein